MHAQPGYLIIPDTRLNLLAKHISELAGTTLGTEAEIAAKISKFDPSVGNLEIIEEAVQLLKSKNGQPMPGFMDALKRVVGNCSNSANPGNIKVARGALYEIERVVELCKQGKVVDSFEVLYKPIDGLGGKSATFDAQVGNTVYEFKAVVHWSIDAINKFREQVVKQLVMVNQHRLNYEIHFKYTISEEIRVWLNDRDITFFEGL